MKPYFSFLVTFLFCTSFASADDCPKDDAYVGRAICMCSYGYYGQSKSFPVSGSGKTYLACATNVRKACDTIWTEQKFDSCILAHPGTNCRSQE